MRKAKTCSDLNNKKMSNEIYLLRRKVINLIYEAKEVANLPRIDVRVTDTPRNSILGVAGLNDNIIWITEKAISYGEARLRHVVYHEIVHAVTGFRHDSDCPLMAPVIPESVKGKAFYQRVLLGYLGRKQ